MYQCIKFVVSADGENDATNAAGQLIANRPSRVRQKAIEWDSLNSKTMSQKIKAILQFLI